MSYIFYCDKEFLEHILNLSNQGYFGETWEEITRFEIIMSDFLYAFLVKNIDLKMVKNAINNS